MKKKTSKQALKKLPKRNAVKSTEDSIDVDATKAIKEILPILDSAVAAKDGTPRKLKPKEKLHYVNSREFEEEIRTYYKTGDVSVKLGESITKIAHGLSYAPNFINYSYKDDMIGDAIVKMFSALRNKKFKLDSGFSPFSYFTTIAFHAFINRIKKEKKHHTCITEYKEKVYTDLMLNPDIVGENAHIYTEPTDDNYNSTGD